MNNKIIVFLLGFIILLLIYLAFKNDIEGFIKKQSIKSKTSIANLSPVYSFCTDEENKNDNYCLKMLEKYSPIKKSFDELIDKGNVTCSDLQTPYESIGFFEYVGGPNLIKQADYIRLTHQNFYYSDNKLDPYNLDADRDGTPCEQFFTNLFYLQQSEITREKGFTNEYAVLITIKEVLLYKEGLNR